ncbi:MAG: YdcF family protein [Helicobacteraceae bacterium]|nr:YdcF family protein [Helicobacteraceae bacterium]
MSPLSIGLLIALNGLTALYLERLRAAKQLLSLAFVWIALFSYGPISDMLVKPLEQTYPALIDTPVGIDYILVLGNGHKSDASLPISSQVNATALKRLSEGIRHYYRLPGSKLIVSGYNGLYDPNTHAAMQKKMARSLGVDTDDIVMFETAKDTVEEAMMMKKIVGDKPFILVSSATHMPRAYKIFSSYGLNPIAAPTDYYAVGESEWVHMPNGNALEGSEKAFHEYYGLIWEWIKQW